MFKLGKKLIFDDRHKRIESKSRTELAQHPAKQWRYKSTQEEAWLRFIITIPEDLVRQNNPNNPRDLRTGSKPTWTKEGAWTMQELQDTTGKTEN